MQCPFTHLLGREVLFVQCPHGIEEGAVVDEHGPRAEHLTELANQQRAHLSQILPTISNQTNRRREGRQSEHTERYHRSEHSGVSQSTRRDAIQADLRVGWE